MARFILIHGSWQGAWCWREVAPLLEAHGHEAIAIDLPAHGQDPAPPESVTFQDYVDRTLAAVTASKDDSILVGHSMGGAIIRQAAGLAPERICALISIAALLPPSGATMLGFVEGLDPEYLAQILWSPDRRTARISPEGFRRFVLSGCPASVAEAVFPLVTPEPVAPYETPLFFTEPAVPHYYVECLRDRIVPIALQRSMQAGFAADHVYSVDSGHAPHLCLPGDLIRILHRIAKSC